MSGRVGNRVRRGFYLDSVALMRLSREIAERPDVEAAALMIGTPANKDLMAEAGLLVEEGRGAGANDLILAVRVRDDAALAAVLADAEARLAAPVRRQAGASEWQPRTLDAAVAALPGANLALVSVPGPFAAAEARRALRRGLHVMLFSDNVAVADEVALKQEAARRGLLLMGPDCGTAMVAGLPLGFANAVPAGDVGIVAASGTGAQEVAALLARGGRGVSHILGVGGRDLSAAVGGLATETALAALARDDATRAIVVVAKPPSPAVAARLLERLAGLGKPALACFVGAHDLAAPPGVSVAAGLSATARTLLGAAAWARIEAEGDAAPVSPPPAGRRRLRGLFAGGTLCAEAQTVLLQAGERVASNAPVPGAAADTNEADVGGHVLLDLGDDAYTRGRPHPMIEPAVRDAPLAEALADPACAVVLLDVVLGHGADADPAGAVTRVLAAHAGPRPALVASVLGTDTDPQNRAAQVAALRTAGVRVAATNAAAAELALRHLRGR